MAKHLNMKWIEMKGRSIRINKKHGRISEKTLENRRKEERRFHNS